ncbi:MAG: HYR domain-containing protein [Acidobacteria bacterium]|nr:HYR domain-containing protein [Acidobacteriota bacterium]
MKRFTLRFSLIAVAIVAMLWSVWFYQAIGAAAATITALPLAGNSRMLAVEPLRPSWSSGLFNPNSVAAANVREATGGNAAAIQTTVDSFRADLGTLRPNTKTSFPDGRREINWDGVPDNFAAPGNLPADFFNNNSPRGAVFSTSGTGFQVSMDDDNPADADPDQVRFDNLNATYSSQFAAFSAQRLFSALNSNITEVTFFIPGTNIPATVTGFGAVFTDVDSGGSTSLQFFDANGNLMLIRSVLATPGSQSLSFLGVSFTDGQRIARVRITSGNATLGGNDNPGTGVDIVAMDDFIYAEPQPAVCPPSTITGDIGQGSADYPSNSGVQSGRLSQNGVDSTCVAPKTCPGVIAGSNFTFDAYQFVNHSNSTACVTFTFPTACGVNNAVHPVAYLGTFDPANPCSNYLGDIGHSINSGESGALSVNVPANSIVVLVVHEVGTQPGCQGYSFSVTGLPTCPPTGGCTLTCPANIAQSSAANQCGAVVSYAPPTASGQCGAITCTPASGSFFSLGATTVTCTAGNTASCTFTVTVMDTQPPALTCPPDLTTSALQNSCSATASCVVVNYSTPTAADNCSGATVICTPPSGSCFSKGTTTVTCTATDASNNTATCSFRVNVFDVCLQDDNNPTNVLVFNSTTGDYRFCCNGTTITGKGTVTIKGCSISLQHNTSNRRVTAMVDKTVFRGSASLQSPPGTTACTLVDRDIRNNACACP